MESRILANYPFTWPFFYFRWLYFGNDDPPVVVTTTSKPTLTSKRLDTNLAVPLSGQGGPLPDREATTTTTTYANDVGQPAGAEVSSYSSSLIGYVDDSAKYALRKVGNYVPIKSVASMAADLGIPGERGVPYLGVETN